MKFAKYVFLIAGIYGLLVMFPQYFTEAKVGIDYPPAITHPEYYYGFIGVTLAWQILFIFISQDPLCYRRLMIPCMLEKFLFPPAVAVLYIQGRVSLFLLPFALIDFVLGILFVIAYIKTNEGKPV